MANHVSSYVSFYCKEDQKALDSLMEEKLKGFDLIDSERPVEEYMERMGFEIDKEQEGYRNYNIEILGSKWVVMEDAYETSLSLTSAWSVPFDMVSTVCDLLEKEIGKPVFATISYEDEGYCFIGSALVDSSGMDDCIELEGGVEEIAEELGVEPYDEEEFLTEEFYDAVQTFIDNSEFRVLGLVS